MGEENIKVQKETEYEKAIKEILNDNIDIQSQGKDVESLKNTKSSFDKTNEILLKYYNSKNESDFQNQLKDVLSIKVLGKLKVRLDEANASNIKEEQEEQIRDMSKEVLKGEQIDENIKERAIKKAQKQALENSEVDLKAEIMIAVYEEAYEQYSYLLKKYKMNQLKDESLTIGDKEGTELVLYERYLINLEKSYAGYAKSKGLDIKKLDDEPDIKAKKEKLEYDMKKMTRSNDLAIDENVRRIKLLSDRRNAIGEEMSELVENRNNMSTDEFERRMEAYKKDYFEVTVELRAEEPSLEEYKYQIGIEDVNTDFYNRKIGLSDDEIRAGAYQEFDSFGNEREDFGDENLEEIQEINEDYSYESHEFIEEMLKKAKYELQYGSLEEATKIIESMEMITEVKNVEQREADGETSKLSNEQVKDEIEQAQGYYSDSSFIQQMQSGVASDKEARLQARLRNIEDNLRKEENIKEQKKEQKKSAQVYVRTRFNKKH